MGAWGQTTELGWNSTGSAMPLWQKTNPSFHFSFTSSKPNAIFQCDDWQILCELVSKAQDPKLSLQIGSN